MITRRQSLILLAATGVTAASSIPAAAKPPVYMLQGVAIRGIDPVSYFTKRVPLEGKEDITVKYDGAIWRFASPSNKALFESNPPGYAPKYGGYCAFAVAKGSTAPTDPEAWTIHKGALYLNFNLRVRATWRENIAENIEKADANWPGVLA